MTSRERVLCALNHEEPDRVPIFFGTSGGTTMLAPGYERLRAHLGMSKGETRFLSKILQYAVIDEEIMVRFGSDGRLLAPRAGPSPLRRETSETALVDEWGIRWQRQPGVLYYEVQESPLGDATIDDIDHYPWPDLDHPDRFIGLIEEARGIRHAGYAVVGISGVSLMEQIWLLRGLDVWLVDLVEKPDFAGALLEKVTSLMLASIAGFLGEVGDYVDVLVMSDDLGAQSWPVISPALYRKMIKPHHARLINAVKRHSEAKVFFHSDGNVYPLIGDLIDVGVDILNPVQVSANDMGDTARLKREFGEHLAFCGAIDTQRILPFGSPDDVREEVRQRIRDLGPGGGYICASVHCIQPDVPPENVCAMFEAAMVTGRYPLAP